MTSETTFEANTDTLFTPFKAGSLELNHRVVMAPLTRSRTGSDRVPTDLMREYYEQRSSAAMIISEATIISPTGAGYAFTPGIYNQAQIDGWKNITNAVQANGAKMISQLWHCGRISHPDLQPNGETPVAPSASIPGEASGQAFTEAGWQPFVEPRALTEGDIKALISDFRQAAANAKAAGFDGIEIHSANGYLLNQFLSDDVNKRTDSYGGSIENRARLLFEVLDAVSEVWPLDKIGVRVSPWNTFLEATLSDNGALYEYVITKLNEKGIAYLSVVELANDDLNRPKDKPDLPESINAFVRQYFKGPILTAGGFKAETAAAEIALGNTDMVAFGQPYIANPDLVERFKKGADLNTPDFDTFYGGDAKGYTDYPFLK
ncbi:alkene reductase [Kordiimonas sp. SCSIO 12603]|uniref:alkene reductase n=1 Tax=Kordiimonas sp. SCSIO 12603 TaxID=2829596 RepID=UPI002107E6B2|nr:alkene reductase [Kordiimonas sp. SCSIO 12603]UTW59944.1 alkene reductase [Kordiimonas sp. SCSIO 12603]